MKIAASENPELAHEEEKKSQRKQRQNVTSCPNLSDEFDELAEQDAEEEVRFYETEGEYLAVDESDEQSELVATVLRQVDRMDAEHRQKCFAELRRKYDL